MSGPEARGPARLRQCVLQCVDRQQDAFVARLVRLDRGEGGEGLARFPFFAADGALGVLAYLVDAGGVAADSNRGERRSRGLAEQAAAYLMGDLGDLARVVELHVDGDPIAAQRIVAPRRLGRCGELARTGLRLGEGDDAVLIQLV